MGQLHGKGEKIRREKVTEGIFQTKVTGKTFQMNVKLHTTELRAQRPSGRINV